MVSKNLQLNFQINWMELPELYNALILKDDLHCPTAMTLFCIVNQNKKYFFIPIFIIYPQSSTLLDLLVAGERNCAIFFLTFSSETYYSNPKF